MKRVNNLYDKIVDLKKIQLMYDKVIKLNTKNKTPTNITNFRANLLLFLRIDLIVRLLTFP